MARGPKTTGDRLRQARQDRGLTQDMLAQRLGLSKTVLASHERELRSVSLRSIEAYAEQLGVSPGWLAFGVGEPVPGMDGVFIGGGRLQVDIEMESHDAMQIASVIMAMQTKGGAR